MGIGDVDKNQLPVEYDPWDVPEFKDNSKKWHERTAFEKFIFIAWDCIGRWVILLGLLYLFICSLDFLSSAFRLLGGKAAGEVFAESELLSNPVAGLMMGVLVTVLVQSSSTSTSIVITMVSSEVIPAKEAVYIIMGANIGTTVTNTIVSLAQSGDRDEFRRAFGGATVHDMFNWLSVAIFLPIEAIVQAATGEGPLFRFTKWLVHDVMSLTPDPEADREFLKKITKPFTDKVIKVDKKIITRLALGDETAKNSPVLKTICDKVPINVTLANGTVIEDVENIRCDNLFAAIDKRFELSDSVAGVIILIVALVILCVCLVLIVKLLHGALKGKIATIIKKFINYDLPQLGYFGEIITGILAILLGAGLTVLVQSSSIFTSAMTPLVGVGVIHLRRMYPLTLGANIGTTATGILAALSQSTNLDLGMQIAMVHFWFNIAGISIWFPWPYIRKIPIKLAMTLGNTTADYRWFAILYLFLVFFIVPAFVFGLSVAHWGVLIGVGGPILLFFIAIVVINVLQRKRPEWICCDFLRSWNFLPLWMHSLEPLDSVFRKICFCRCCHRVFCDKNFNSAEDGDEVRVQNGKSNPAYEKDLDVERQF